MILFYIVATLKKSMSLNKSHGSWSESKKKSEEGFQFNLALHVYLGPVYMEWGTPV